MSKIVQRLLRVDCALFFFDLGSSVSKLGMGGDGVLPAARSQNNANYSTVAAIYS